MMKQLTKNKRLFFKSSKEDESGAMILMAYFSIFMFLLFAVLMLDVPYLEKVGRSMQRTIDTAALSGAIQLTLKNSMIPPANVLTNDPERERGWRNSKKAVFAFLRLNPIFAAESLNFSPALFTGPQDPLDGSAYGYETYSITGGSGLTANLKISRGVYHRPNNWSGSANIKTFYRTENGPYSASDQDNYWKQNVGCGLVRDCIRCESKTFASNTHEYPPGNIHVYEPTECTPDQRVIDVADSVQLTLTINNIPTLFGKILGLVGSTPFTTTSLTRTAVGVPE